MNHKKVSVIVGGAAGRMGRTILALAYADPEIRIAGAFEQPRHIAVGRDVGDLIGGGVSLGIPIHPHLGECVQSGEAVIDFTSSKAVEENLRLTVQAKRGMVIGTTGFSAAFTRNLKSASQKIPIVQAPNMSIGVNLLFKLVSLVGRVLDERYDIEIVEEHHRHKKDAPSGTALELARLLAQARKINLEGNAVFGRKGITGERPRGSIGIHAVRGGDTIGAHTVSFIGDGERLELIHRASSREAFGLGAILAAKFVAKQKNGLYNMADVLGI